MTQLTLAARNLLAQDDELCALLGSDATWSEWIFADRLYVTIESSQRCGIVITEGGTHDASATSTARYPILNVDIWADPTRNPNKAVRVHDADDKIEAISKLLDRHLHTVNLDVPTDAPSWWGMKNTARMWGTATQIADRTGIAVLGSERRRGPEYSDVTNTDGTRMGRMTYNVTHF